MENLQDRVLLRMEQIGITQSELSTIINKSSVTIYKILSGNQHDIMGKTLIDLSEALRCNPSWLQRGVGPITLGGGDGLLAFMPNLPILSVEQVSDWPKHKFDHESTSYRPCYESCSYKGFWFNVANNDAAPKLEVSDLVCVDPDRKELENGKFIVIRFKKNKAISIKKISIIDNDIYLQSTNPLYPQNIAFTAFDDELHEIVGTIVCSIKSL